MTRLLPATLFVSLAVAPPAFAEWTIGAFAGGAHTQRTSLTITRPAESTSVSLAGVRHRSESMEPPIYYGYRIAFFPGWRWLGIEGELIHLKVVADTARDVQISGLLRGEPVGSTVRMSSVIEDFSITHGVNLLLVNAVLRRQAVVDRGGDARFAVTARLGAGASVPHPESTIGGRHVEGYEWGAASVQAAAGIEMHVKRRVSVFAEYKLTHTAQDVRVAEGTARTPLTTHHVVAGLALRLGARD